MTIFITGCTGYLGSYVVAELLANHDSRFAVLVRASSVDQARQRLWQAWQLHMDFPTFDRRLRSRVEVYLGDLTQADLGLASTERGRLVRATDSIIHCAASLNRKSAKSCFNVNLRGSMHLIKLARAIHGDHGLRRFSSVSTMAVAGHRHAELVTEDDAVDWQRSDYDPYARTKKFGEYLLRELLPDVPLTIFRPSTVLGDSRFEQTTQFDMVQAFAWLAHLPVLPFSADWRIDVVSADYVGRAIAEVHQLAQPEHDIYHLSSGIDSPTYGAICDSLVSRGHRIRPRFVASLAGPFRKLVAVGAATPRRWRIAPAMSLLQVFLPYLEFDTVFDNQRIVGQLGQAPAPFTTFAYDLLRFAMDNHFTYPYRPWPNPD